MISVQDFCYWMSNLKRKLLRFHAAKLDFTTSHLQVFAAQTCPTNISNCTNCCVESESAIRYTGPWCMQITGCVYHTAELDLLITNQWTTTAGWTQSCSFFSLHLRYLKAWLWVEANEYQFGLSSIPAVCPGQVLSTSVEHKWLAMASLCTREKVWSRLLITWRNDVNMRQGEKRGVEGQTDSERWRNLWEFQGRWKTGDKCFCKLKVSWWCVFEWEKYVVC